MQYQAICLLELPLADVSAQYERILMEYLLEISLVL